MKKAVKFIHPRVLIGLTTNNAPAFEIARIRDNNANVRMWRALEVVPHVIDSGSVNLGATSRYPLLRRLGLFLDIAVLGSSLNESLTDNLK
ncbi:hypothetical protein ACFFUP_16580 [Vibrio ostreicida]|uniref:Uncharacterized protein n=1 Tax=Vibrio ostreicida TaxID=526588 RepID=A0ABT8BZU6_9VIBR|nr:hypothetical protein [Vibrio ostreicida]MDN3611884.1 hypothetical protein [Vibrio ostreicida]NPD10947.1 hypothetical protein [Vibrio ostreicida]